MKMIEQKQAIRQNILNDGNVGHIENTNKNNKQGSLEWVKLDLFGGQLMEYSSLGFKWKEKKTNVTTI